MKLYSKIMTLLVLVILVISCIAMAEASQKVTLYVLTDRNITPDLDASQVRSQNQMADWWENDLVNMLARRGKCDVRWIHSHDEYVPGSDTYLLTSTILQYNPGCKVKRILIKFGAGRCSMDLRTEIYGPDDQQLFAKDDSIASIQDWRCVARKLNEMILDYVKNTLKNR